MTVALNLLLTGATGFLGRQLANVLHSKQDINLTVSLRRDEEICACNKVIIRSIDSDTSWLEALAGQQIVIHAAARAHVMRDEVADPLAEFRKVNVEGTINLAKQAVAAGVKRFVFISSIGVHGLNSSRPFKETDTEAPHDAYAISKYEAEQGLRKLSTETDLEVVIIRPPLVYGSAAPGNFRSLINLASKPVPLPFGSVNNKRSMVYVGNLVDFIVRCINHPNAANETFLVSDGNDVSLRSLLIMMRSAMGRSPRLVPVPVGLFKLVGALTGKRGVVDRLVGDLQVDSSKARSLLGWIPPYTVEQGIAATVADFMSKDK